MSSESDIDELIENKLFLDKLAKDEYFFDKLINNKYYLDRLRNVLNLKISEKKLYYEHDKFIMSYLEYTKLDIPQVCYLMEHNKFNDYIDIIIPNNTDKFINFSSCYFSCLLKENNIEKNDNTWKFIRYLYSNGIKILNIFEFQAIDGYQQSIANHLLTNYCNDINDFNMIVAFIPKKMNFPTHSSIESQMEKEKKYETDKKLKMFAKIKKIYDNYYDSPY